MQHHYDEHTACHPHTLGGFLSVTSDNSLAPGRFGGDFKILIFNLVLLIGILRSLYDNALRWMPRNITDDKSTLVQVMAWCRQATSHYLGQFWPKSMSPHGVIRPQRVNSHHAELSWENMMTSSSENIFRVTGPHLCGEFTGHRWIPLTKASDAEFWCFLWSAPEKTVD